MLYRFIGKMIIVSFPADAKRSRFSENRLATLAFESSEIEQQKHFFVGKYAVNDFSSFPVVNGFGLSSAFRTEKNVARTPYMQTDVLIWLQAVENQPFKIKAIYDIFFHTKMVFVSR